MGKKGCWTCRERKVKCDSQWPTCGNCTKARRVCQGYGIQLSWPRDGDKKRAMISQDTQRTHRLKRLRAKSFLNSSSWDVSLSEDLENRRVLSRHLRTMIVPRPTYLSPIVVSREESQLLGFFNESRSLTLGPTDEEVLANFILKIAFSDVSDATNPVLQGVFALASLQLNGATKSFRYKHLTLSSVAKDLDSCIDEKALLQSLMGMMLLYQYELSLDDNDKGNWVAYICGVKRVINTSPAIHKLIREEYSILLDWIYYHESLAEFTVRHWKRPYEGCGYAPLVRSPRTVQGGISKGEESIGCPIDVLQLVVNTCRRAIVVEPREASIMDAELNHMKLLECDISRAVGDYGPIHVQSTISMEGRQSTVSDLHRLASLIYINRAVHHVTGTEFSHRRLVREGILLLTKMVTCQNAWPLFIIACEAAEDDQRLAILEVFDQTRCDRRRRSSHINFIQHMVEGVWNQHDLDAENQVDHMSILDAVIGGVPFMPLFA